MHKNSGVAAIAALLFSFACASRAEMPSIDFDRAGLSAKDIVSLAREANPELSAAVPAASAAKTTGTTAAWTIMVYMNGKNSLESHVANDMNEMETAGSNPGVNVLVEIGRQGYSVVDGGWRGVRRYLVRKDTDTAHITSPVLQSFDNADMGDYRHLIHFGRWAMTNFPARHYMLIVWNHGSGWVPDTLSESKGISFDDDSHHNITTPQLGEALAALGHLDVYGSDACFMQMPEVDYEIRKSVDFIVGSEEAEPGDGATYDAFLPLVTSSSKPEEVAKAAVDTFTDHYVQTKTGSTQSFIKASELDTFAQLVNKWVDTVQEETALSANEWAVIKAARANALSFTAPDNKDLAHFLNLLAQTTGSVKMKAASLELSNFITAQLVQHNRFSNGKSATSSWADYGNANGLAIYLPNNSYDGAYEDLQWAKDTTWPQVVKWLLQK